MKNIRIKAIILSVLTSVIVATAQITYANAAARADRFFGYHEWASAAALYNYMLKEKPDVVDTYGRAIVANSMLNDSIRSMSLLTEAMSYNIPLDSVLTQVQKYSFIVGHGSLYENFMLQAARENSWLARPINNYLLRYYAFRNNGSKMIEYAQQMLRGAEGNPSFMLTLAKGYMLENQPMKAVETWKELLSTSPDNCNALLCLANFYYEHGDRHLALDYFTRAFDLKPTPYVQKMIERLTEPI